MKNWRDIVESFTEIEDVLVQSNPEKTEWCVRTRGTLNGHFQDSYSYYNNKEVAEKVAEKVSYFIGIK